MLFNRFHFHFNIVLKWIICYHSLNHNNNYSWNRKRSTFSRVPINSHWRTQKFIIFPRRNTRNPKKRHSISWKMFPIFFHLSKSISYLPPSHHSAKTFKWNSISYDLFILSLRVGWVLYELPYTVCYRYHILYHISVSLR